MSSVSGECVDAVAAAAADGTVREGTERKT